MMRWSGFAILVCLLAFGRAERAEAQFPAHKIEFLSHVPLAAMGGGGGSDIWGWTDPQTHREYALFGRTNGTSFIDITDPRQPQYLGNLPTHTGNSLWRDIKVYQNYAYIVSDQNGPHGIQIFDLTTLRGVTTPQTFAETAHFAGIRTAHNIAINEDSGFAYVVASDVGNRAVDLSNPTQPVLLGSTAGGHDVQAVIYHGPDTDYTGREILIASTGNSRIRIQDVTDKQNVTSIAFPLYPNGRYSHQGWLTDDHRFFFLNDELDSNWTHRFDVSDLDNPQYLGVVPALENSIDHNLYVKGEYLYAANYTSGLQVSRIDLQNGNLERVAWIDTYPVSNGMFYDGAWSVYPFFDSGTLIVSDMSNGLIVARLDVYAGDFNHDGLLDCADADALTAAIASGSNTPEFDLSGDGLVTLADRDAWLTEAGAANLASGNAYLVGDANLDGVVDAQDFIVWNNNKFTLTAAWCRGDLNADGRVDALDFVEWNDHKFMSSDGVSQVPEPSDHGVALLISCGLAALVGSRPWRSAVLG